MLLVLFILSSICLLLMTWRPRQPRSGGCRGSGAACSEGASRGRPLLTSHREGAGRWEDARREKTLWCQMGKENGDLVKSGAGGIFHLLSFSLLLNEIQACSGTDTFCLGMKNGKGILLLHDTGSSCAT